MIRFRDSLTLSLTKLRTRKVRLVVTVVVSGLLFCGLAAASFIARGAFNSTDAFNKDGFGERYIVQAYKNQAYPDLTDPKLIEKVAVLQKDLVARKKVAAKALGIEYVASLEVSPIQEYDNGAGGKQRNLDDNHSLTKQALRELNTAPVTSQDEITKIAKPYNVKSTYESQQYKPYGNTATLQVLKGGKEAFDQTDSRNNEPPKGTDSFTTFWSLMSSSLMQPFVLKGATLEDKADGSIPIIVPVSAAEQLLGLKALPGSASTAEKLDRMKDLRAKALSITFQVCYRNGTSSELVQNALNTARELEQNKTNKQYQKPELIYGLPATPCSPVVATRDVRDADTKKLAIKQEQFNVQFGKVSAEQQTLNFRVVGMSPDINYGSAFGVSQIVSSLVTSSLGTGWYTPKEFDAKVPLLKTLFTQNTSGTGSPPSYYAEFSNATDARNFIKQQSCTPDFALATGPGSDPFVKCRAEGKNFSLNPFGSNSLALDSAKSGFGKAFGIAVLVAASIAAIIMMGTVGRMIADSRRETAVFRAIGAKRIDIAQVYILYTVLLAVLICIFSIGIGLIAAGFVDNRYGPEVTVQALVAYNAQDLTQQFHLLYIYPIDMLRLIGLILAASVISSFLPLLRNLRRNPIRDMRDDT